MNVRCNTQHTLGRRGAQQGKPEGLVVKDNVDLLPERGGISNYFLVEDTGYSPETHAEPWHSTAQREAVPPFQAPCRPPPTPAEPPGSALRGAGGFAPKGRDFPTRHLQMPTRHPAESVPRRQVGDQQAPREGSPVQSRSPKTGPTLGTGESTVLTHRFPRNTG